MSSGYLDRPRSSSLADVIEIILDKGIVIDAYVRVSLVGVDTYLRFAEATNRLDLTQQGGKDLSELMGDVTQKGAKGKTSGALVGVMDALTGGGHDRGDRGRDHERDHDHDHDRDEQPERRRRVSSTSS